MTAVLIKDRLISNTPGTPHFSIFSGIFHRLDRSSGFAAKFRILSTFAQISQPKRARTVKKSILNPGTGGSNEKAVSRKRSAGRNVGGSGGIRCRHAAKGTCPRRRGHLDWLLCRSVHWNE